MLSSFSTDAIIWAQYEEAYCFFHRLETARVQLNKRSETFDLCSDFAKICCNLVTLCQNGLVLLRQIYAVQKIALCFTKRLCGSKIKSYSSSRYSRLPTASAQVRARAGHVWFVVDKVALGQIFSEYLGFPCQWSFRQILHPHNNPGQVQWANW
jgi:hypothetical protein